MLGSLVLYFREVLEMCLIISVVMAATKGVPNRTAYLVFFIACGVLLSYVFSHLLDSLENIFGSNYQDFFNLSIISIALVMISWTVLWMKKHGARLQQHLKHSSRAVVDGNLPLVSLGIIVMCAVLREGVEIVIFTYGMLYNEPSLASFVVGAIIGTLLAIFLGIGLYFGLIRFSISKMFNVTANLLILIAAGLAANLVTHLNAIGFAPLSQVLWDSSNFVDQSSVVGITLHSLIGYQEQPNLLQVIFYLATLSSLYYLQRKIHAKR